MIIGSPFNTYSINQSSRAGEPAANPAEKPATTDSAHQAQNTQSKPKGSSLDSLGQGNLT